jgi:hypothetical protein
MLKAATCEVCLWGSVRRPKSRLEVHLVLNRGLSLLIIRVYSCRIADSLSLFQSMRLVECFLVGRRTVHVVIDLLGSVRRSPAKTQTPNGPPTSARWTALNTSRANIAYLTRPSTPGVLSQSLAPAISQFSRGKTQLQHPAST